MIYLMDPRWMDKVFAAPEPPAPDESLVRRREALQDLLSFLPTPWTRVVTLYLEETPLSSIDEQLGMTPGYARTTLRSARKKLKRMAKQVFPELCANGNGRER